MNTDFVIVRVAQTGADWFWTGRGWWSSSVAKAHVYATREKVEAAIKRSGWGGRVKYETVEEVKARA